MMLSELCVESVYEESILFLQFNNELYVFLQCEGINNEVATTLLKYKVKGEFAEY